MHIKVKELYRPLAQLTWATVLFWRSISGIFYIYALLTQACHFLEELQKISIMKMERPWLNQFFSDKQILTLRPCSSVHWRRPIFAPRQFTGACFLHADTICFDHRQNADVRGRWLLGMSVSSLVHPIGQLFSCVLPYLVIVIIFYSLFNYYGCSMA